MPIYTDKKTKRLYIQFDFLGVTYKKRLPEGSTDQDAEKLETKLKYDLFFESNGIGARKEITFEKFLVEYFLPFAEKHYVKGSFDNAVVLCKAAMPFFRGKLMRQIKTADVERLKDARAGLPTKHGTKRKPATIVREMGVYSKIFSFARKNEFLEYNPCSNIERPIFNNFQSQVLSEDDTESFLSNFKSDWARDVSELMLNTGLRQNDALGLSKSHIDWELNLIRLIQGKTKRIVELPMNDRVQEIIRARWQNGSELLFPSPRTGKQGTSIKKALEGACERAKISKLGTRVLRRTFGTVIEELNFSSTVQAKLLGHGDLRSLNRYGRGKKILREAVQALPKTNFPKSYHPAKIDSKKRL